MILYIIIIEVHYNYWTNLNMRLCIESGSVVRRMERLSTRWGVRCSNQEFFSSSAFVWIHSASSEFIIRKEFIWRCESLSHVQKTLRYDRSLLGNVFISATNLSSSISILTCWSWSFALTSFSSSGSIVFSSLSFRICIVIDTSWSSTFQSTVTQPSFLRGPTTIPQSFI